MNQQQTYPSEIGYAVKRYSGLELPKTLSSPLAMVATIGALAMTAIGLLVAFCAAMAVGYSLFGDPEFSDLEYLTESYSAESSAQSLRGESGLVNGTLDQRDIRNSVIAVDGEVLNLPN